MKRPTLLFGLMAVALATACHHSSSASRAPTGTAPPAPAPSTSTPSTSTPPAPTPPAPTPPPAAPPPVPAPPPPAPVPPPPPPAPPPIELPPPPPAPPPPPPPPPVPPPPPAPPPPGTGSSPLTRGPYLQQSTATSTLVIWETASVTSQALLVDGARLIETQLAARHEVRVDALAPLTTHSYAIVERGKTVAGPFAFHTAPAPGDDAAFSFVVFGDSGAATAEQQTIASRMTRERSDFVLHTGDVIYPSGSAADYPERYFQPYRALIRRESVFPTPGNHDYQDPGAAGYFDAFRTFANNPEGTGRYYSFVWGSLHVISIDTWSDFQTTGPTPALMSWLRSELGSSTSRWKVVFMHVPAYGSGASHAESEPIRDTLVPLFEEYGVDLVLQGHDHAYERLAPISRGGVRSVRYVISGGGGAAPYHADPIPESELRLEVFHYLVVDVDTERLRIRAIDLDGRTIDDFSVAH